MIRDALMKMVEQTRYTGKNPLYIRNVLKEGLQNFVLSFIYNSAPYKHLIFTGGTCLRKIYGLPRLSEDLDFDYTDRFSIENFAHDIQNHFTGTLQEVVTTKMSGNKNSLFIKFPSLLQQMGFVASPADSPLLFLRCDFSKESVGIFDTEIHSLSTLDFTFFVKAYDMPTLFANKITAFLKRDFYRGPDQDLSFKGRDVFDLVWFVEQSKRNNFQLKPQSERMHRLFPDRSLSEIMQAVAEKAQKIDPSQVYRDLAPFIASGESITAFTHSFAAILTQNVKYLV